MLSLKEKIEKAKEIFVILGGNEVDRTYYALDIIKNEEDGNLYITTGDGHLYNKSKLPYFTFSDLILKEFSEIIGKENYFDGFPARDTLLEIALSSYLAEKKDTYVITDAFHQERIKKIKEFINSKFYLEGPDNKGLTKSLKEKLITYSTLKDLKRFGIKDKKELLAFSLSMPYYEGLVEGIKIYLGEEANQNKFLEYANEGNTLEELLKKYVRPIVEIVGEKEIKEVLKKREEYKQLLDNSYYFKLAETYSKYKDPITFLKKLSEEFFKIAYKEEIKPKIEEYTQKIKEEVDKKIETVKEKYKHLKDKVNNYLKINKIFKK